MKGSAASVGSAEPADSLGYGQYWRSRSRTPEVRERPMQVVVLRDDLGDYLESKDAPEDFALPNWGTVDSALVK
jgi:hypothetical protein